MFELILKIILAHLLGDFVFQTNKMVTDIDEKKFKSQYLYYHILIHFGLLLLLTNFEKKYIIPALILSLSHLIIDCFTKIIIKNKIKSITNLILDQLLHLLTIIIFISNFYTVSLNTKLVFSTSNYLFLISTICITYVAAIFIKKIMELFNYPLPNDGLKDAGKYIGMLERLFVFIFVICSFWEGIGFLLAAKSIFRFGDLKEQKDIRLTEYILIGTLLSFGIAIAIGKIFLILNKL